MVFDGFSVFDFVPELDVVRSQFGGVVYVFCWLANGVETPFYVGQTNRFSGRMRDYGIASFKACTDFCVGEAVRYLRNVKNYRVTVRYKSSADSLAEEKAIIRSLLISGVWLLNCLPRYDYRTDSEAREREVVQRFCDMFTENQYRSDGWQVRKVHSS